MGSDHHDKSHVWKPIWFTRLGVRSINKYVQTPTEVERRDEKRAPSFLDTVPAGFASTTGTADRDCRSTLVAHHQSNQPTWRPGTNHAVRPSTPARVHDLFLGYLLTKDTPGRWLQGIHDGVVKTASRSSSHGTGPGGGDRALLNAGHVLRSIQGSLLRTPGQYLRSSNLALGVAVGRSQIDVSKSKLNDIDIATLKELELLAKRGCKTRHSTGSRDFRSRKGRRQGG